LAMRAADAAKNTANLIEGTLKRVKEGSELVKKTYDGFRDTAAGVGKSCDLSGEISAASREQAQGIEQVDKAVSEMNKVVQQNASYAEESACASNELRTEAALLEELVSDLAALVGTMNNPDRQRTGPAMDRKKPAVGAEETQRVFSLKRLPGDGKGNGKEHDDPGKRMLYSQHAPSLDVDVF